MHAYDDDFYTYLNTFAERSAGIVAPVVAAAAPTRSVVDFGCGEGAWLRAWRGLGADIFGLDGPHVRRERLLIPQAAFQAADLSAPIDLGRRFDLAQSLEVAEHLPRRSSAGFVRTLARHADHVLFSAAVPGQGGEHHVNERPLEYWRGLFAAEGFRAVDLVRPAVRGDARVQGWYRCNAILYVRDARLAELPAAARGCIVPDDVRLGVFWRPAERVRHLLLRPLPVGAVSALARLNAARVARTA